MRSQIFVERGEHPEFPSQVYGYVAFRTGYSAPGAHRRFSTPFETDRDRLQTRIVERAQRSEKTAPELLLATFELVTVDVIVAK